MPKDALLDAYDWNSLERVVVLSPHLDDAALSCGALLAALRGRVPMQVVSVCAGDPPGDGSRPGPGVSGFASPAERRREDAAALRALDCEVFHLGFPDAIYRRDPATGRPLYHAKRGYIAAPATADQAHIDEVALVLSRLVQGAGELLLVAPLGIGHHVDHVICARAALRAAGEDTPLLLYEDFPYVVEDALVEGRSDDAARALRRLGREPARRLTVPINVAEKAKLAGAYESQIDLLFGDAAVLEKALAKANSEGYWVTVPGTAEE